MDLGDPHDPGTAVAGYFRGRIPRLKAAAIVERNDRGVWHEVGRYSTVADAKRAVDEAMAAGTDPGSLRVTETHPRQGLLLVLGAAMAIAAVAIVTFILLR